MIELNHLSVVLPSRKSHPTQILKNINLKITRGDWMAVTGPNGSGKTTLLKVLAGVAPVSEGSMTAAGAGAELAYALLLQDIDNQFVSSSVCNELLLSVPGAAADPVAAEKRMKTAAERFSLEPFFWRNPHDLSGGEKQRLAMATVWLSEPDVLLLDEPVSFLDGPSRRACLRFVRELNEAGVTIVWATPGGEELLYARSIVCLESGEVRYAGNRDEFLESISSHHFGAALPKIFALGKQLVEEVSKDAADSSRTEASSQDDGDLNDTVVSLEKVSFAYPNGNAVLHNINLDIDSGECLGITGPNGSGKTSLIEMIGGISKPASGEIELKYPTPVENRQQKIFYLFQSPEQMFFAETVLEEISFGLKNLGKKGGDVMMEASGALRRVGLKPERVLGRSPFRLSHGEMRRVAFAIAVVLGPELLLLDEPTSCLDEEGYTLLRKLIESYKKEGKSVVIASHDIDFLCGACDRLVFLEEGCVKGTLALEKRELDQDEVWPGGDKPFILELQESGSGGWPRALSVDRYIDKILNSANGRSL